MPASFRGARFHVDTSSKESGQRIVVHEFPKKDLPYAEGMGRRAIEFSVRGYCIAYPVAHPSIELYNPDYRKARDRLLTALETGGDGVLQLPFVPPMSVVCPRFRMTEEDKLGGFCVFDMQFVEFGRRSVPREDSGKKLIEQSRALIAETERLIATGLVK